MTKREHKYHNRIMVSHMSYWDSETGKVIHEKAKYFVPKSKFHKAIEKSLKQYRQ